MLDVVALHVDGVDVLAAELVLALALGRHAPFHLALGGKLPGGQDLLLREEREVAEHAVGQASHEVGLQPQRARAQALDYHVEADDRGHHGERHQDDLGLADVCQVVLAHQPHKEPQIEGVDQKASHEQGTRPGKLGPAGRADERVYEVARPADEVLPDIARRAAEEGLPGRDAPDQKDRHARRGEGDGKGQHEQRHAAPHGHPAQGLLQELAGVEDGDGQKRPQGGVTAALQTGAEGHRAGPELQEERGGKGQRVVAHLLPPR